MNKRVGIVLVLITLVSVSLATYEWAQLRRARQIVKEDLSSAVAPEPAATAVPATVLPSPADLKLIESLQAQLAAANAARDKLQSDLAAVQLTLADRAGETNRPARTAMQPPSTNGARRASFEDRMARLKQEDPARYEEMQKQREEFNKRIQTQADERSDFLKKIDTAAMTEEQRANHEKLLATAELARATLAQMPTMTAEEASAARRKMFETLGTVSELYQQERRYLLEQTGRAMGYQGAESGQFADYIQQIYDQTSSPRLFGGGRGGMFGGRDGGRTSGATGTPGVGATPAPAK